MITKSLIAGSDNIAVINKSDKFLSSDLINQDGNFSSVLTEEISNLNSDNNLNQSSSNNISNSSNTIALNTLTKDNISTDKNFKIDKLNSSLSSSLNTDTTDKTLNKSNSELKEIDTISNNEDNLNQSNIYSIINQLTQISDVQKSPNVYIQPPSLNLKSSDYSSESINKSTEIQKESDENLNGIDNLKSKENGLSTLLTINISADNTRNTNIELGSIDTKNNNTNINISNNDLAIVSESDILNVKSINDSQIFKNPLDENNSITNTEISNQNNLAYSSEQSDNKEVTAIINDTGKSIFKNDTLINQSNLTNNAVNTLSEIDFSNNSELNIKSIDVNQTPSFSTQNSYSTKNNLNIIKIKPLTRNVNNEQKNDVIIPIQNSYTKKNNLNIINLKPITQSINNEQKKNAIISKQATDVLSEQLPFNQTQIKTSDILSDIQTKVNFTSAVDSSVSSYIDTNQNQIVNKNIPGILHEEMKINEDKSIKTTSNDIVKESESNKTENIVQNNTSSSTAEQNNNQKSKNGFDSNQQKNLISIDTTKIDTQNSNIKSISEKTETPKYSTISHVKLEDLPVKISELASNTTVDNSTTTRLILTPRTLGTIFVEINLKKDSASIKLNSESSDTAKLIDQNIGSLRDKLQSQGINVQNIEVNVSNQYQAGSQNSRNEAKNESKNFRNDKKNQKYSTANDIENLNSLNVVNSYFRHDNGNYIEKYI